MEAIRSPKRRLLRCPWQTYRVHTQQLNLIKRCTHHKYNKSKTIFHSIFSCWPQKRRHNVQISSGTMHCRWVVSMQIFFFNIFTSLILGLIRAQSLDHWKISCCWFVFTITLTVFEAHFWKSFFTKLDPKLNHHHDIFTCFHDISRV